ncbi:MAG: anti-sigma factor antagonist [Bdellovibrionales bacterium]|nr:anti-sigma factor antagonist [Bdellovibrionales bacterium]
MKTKISNVSDMTIVELSGYLDFENADPFARSIEDIYKANKQAKIVIDLTGLEFVGSSGISSFVKSLRVFNRMRMKPAYCGVKSEFVRLFRAFEENAPFDIWSQMDDAKSAALRRYEEWETKTLRSARTH